jgi:hypothetical protein
MPGAYSASPLQQIAGLATLFASPAGGTSAGAGATNFITGLLNKLKAPGSEYNFNTPDGEFMGPPTPPEIVPTPNTPPFEDNFPIDEEETDNSGAFTDNPLEP